ncbi:hypothetical protein [Nostoc sp. FACHB-892]
MRGTYRRTPIATLKYEAIRATTTCENINILTSVLGRIITDTSKSLPNPINNIITSSAI